MPIADVLSNLSDLLGAGDKLLEGKIESYKQAAAALRDKQKKINVANRRREDLVRAESGAGV